LARRQTWTASDIEPIAFRSDPPQPQLLTPPPVRGLGTADFDVVYQPIVDLRNGRFFAHEALVRCKVEALKSPVVLFEQAVNERACGRLGRTIREVSFARCPGVPLFVNIHPDELGARWLVRPDDPVFFHDNSVFLEITESAAFTHFDLCCDVLREVCSRSGAHLVVDDLGAGYSNLKRIIDLEPKVVKLDRSLIAGLDRRPRQRVLFTSVVKLCADLGARVVAEGIETIDEFKAVRDCGAQYGQGYLLARPGYPPPAVTFPSV
jgi:EAL domain-containing protein (putative c-di-GMP-specific phosphodiesterase class I)